MPLKFRVPAGLVALGLIVAGEAGAQSAAAVPEPPSDFRFTQLFSQFHFYVSNSERDELRFRYRSYGFSTGAGFSWGRSVSGHIYGGYTYASDRIVSPTPSKSFYNLPLFGGSLRYEFMPNLFVGGALSVQPILGRFESATDRGHKRGWSVTASPFVSTTIPLQPFYIDLTGQMSLSHVSVSQPGPSDGFTGSSATASVSAALRYTVGDLFSIGASVTPGFVLVESSRISNRGNGPFFLGFGGNASMRIAGPLRVYGSYTFRLHRADRSAHGGTVGLAWALGQ